MGFDGATPAADHRLEGGGDLMRRRICQMGCQGIRDSGWWIKLNSIKEKDRYSLVFRYSFFAFCEYQRLMKL